MASGTSEAIADSVGAIYHAAAAVDWVRPYEELRDANVFGTRELLRLAAPARQNPFTSFELGGLLFHSATGDALESDDPLLNLRGLRLGYAQSKCVAESLVRQAAERGGRMTVARPTLVSGDSTSGISMPMTYCPAFSRLHRHGGGARSRLGDGLCPVDHVADAMVRLARNGVPASGYPLVYHLANPRLR
jgi:thioester reductase-like protein